MINSLVDFTNIYNVTTDANRQLMWQYVAQRIKAKVKRLMTNGIDVNGRPYKPYSLMYASERTARGLNIRPNLQLTSMMWRSIQARHTAEYFEIYITGAWENEKAWKNNQTRQFFQWGNLLYKELDKSLDIFFRRMGLS